MRPCLVFLVSFTMFLTPPIGAQDRSDNDLVAAYKSHFEIHREQVYLNLNKDHFIPGEEVFFYSIPIQPTVRSSSRNSDQSLRGSL